MKLYFSTRVLLDFGEIDSLLLYCVLYLILQSPLMQPYPFNTIACRNEKHKKDKKAFQ